MKSCRHQENRGEVSIIRRVTWIGFYVNAVLMVLKLIFGYLGHSDALVADGYHSLSDFATDFIILIFIGWAYKRADKEHPYGHGKIETFASMVIGLILLIVAVGIGTGGVISIISYFKGDILPVPDKFTLVIALIAIVSKEWLFRYTYRIGKKIDSSSLKANAWHHRSDAISSIATVAGVGLSLIPGQEWRIMDPLASIIIAVFIGISAVKISKPSINELLEKSLPHDQLEALKKEIRSVKGVIRYHSLRTRRNGHSYIVDVDIHVDPDISVKEGHEIATEVESRLHEVLGKDLIVYVHVEPENEETE